MTTIDKLDSSLSTPLLRVAVVLLCMLIGAWAAYPHLGESLWQDEAATITFHVSRGVVDPFLHYVSPNSHVGFTSMLAAWLKLFPDGVDVVSLRLLPYLLFLAAIPATYAAGFRLGGSVCASLAAIFFSGSVVSSNFATQLRGYGPSWVFISLALFTALGMTPGRRTGLTVATYFLSSLAAVAILPTNFYFLLILGSCVSLPILLDTSGPSWSARREAALALIAIPILALLMAYAGIWRELMDFSSVRFSPWERSDLIIQWLRGSLANILWLTPLVMVGLLALFSRGVDGRAKRERSAHVTAALLVSIFILFLGVVPNPPFPRTLVPYVPIWFCALAFLMVAGFRSVTDYRAGAIAAIAASATALVLAMLPSVRGCGDGALTDAKFDYDLCHQYFRDNYRPEAVLDTWASQPSPLPIVSDFEGYHALRILGSPARIFEYRYYPAEGPVPLIVAHDAGELQKMATHIGRDPRRYRLLADTGYFKVYREPLP